MSEKTEPELQQFISEDHINLTETSLSRPSNGPACSPEGASTSPPWPSRDLPDCQPEFCKVPLCSISAGSSPEAFRLPYQDNTNEQPTETTLEAKPVGIKRAMTDTTSLDDKGDGTPTRNTRSRPTNRRSGRVPHSIVERRYRDNLNNQIEALRLLIPAVRETPQDVEDTLDIPPKAPSKAVVITAAASYIKELEEERSQRIAETKTLYEQVENLQQLLRCDNCSILQYLKSMQLEDEAELQ